MGQARPELLKNIRTVAQNRLVDAKIAWLPSKWSQSDLAHLVGFGWFSIALAQTHENIRTVAQISKICAIRQKFSHLARFPWFLYKNFAPRFAGKFAHNIKKWEGMPFAQPVPKPRGPEGTPAERHMNILCEIFVIRHTFGRKM